MSTRLNRYHHWLLRLCVSMIVIVGYIQASSFSVTALPERPILPADISAMVDQISPVIVNIDAQLGYQQAKGAGTGIIIDPDGIVMTNNHVIAGATDLQAVSVATGHTYDVTVLGYDRTHDVAVLQLLGAQGLPTADLGNSDFVNVGDHVTSMGNVAGHGGRPIAVEGHVIGLNQSVSASDELTGGSESLTNMIEANTPIRPGDSGGPMVNDAGQVIGMNTAATDDGQSSVAGGNGFAIPINQALAIANQIRSGTPSSTVHIGGTAFLGIGVNDGFHGARVVRVIPQTPASEAGIETDDVIVAIDGSPVRSATDLTSLLDQHQPEDTVNVAWQKPNGEQHDADILLSGGPVG